MKAFSPLKQLGKRDQNFIAKALLKRQEISDQYPEEWNELPATRKQAALLDEPFYFGAQPCKHGHISPRQTAKGVCEECHRIHRTSEAALAKNRERYSVRMQDPEFRAAKSRDARRHYHAVMKHDEKRMADHYERMVEYQRENREICNRAQRAHRRRNPGYDRPYVVARRAAIKHSGLTAHEQAQVRSIYQLRAVLTKATGIEYHVDHRIPLSKGGKHHPSNLWVITAVENLRKSAKLPT